MPRKVPPKHHFLPTTRLEGLSDGVFAVAITLLILDIKVPTLAAGQTLADALHGLLPNILTYIVSVIVAGVFWIAHHIMFKFIKQTDRFLLTLNIFLLMFVSAIPFCAALISRYPKDPTAILVYGIVLFLLSLSFMATWLYAAYGRKLTFGTMTKKRLTLATEAVIVAPIMYAIAIIVSFINPVYGLMLYVVTPLIYLLPSPIDDLVEE